MEMCCDEIGCFNKVFRLFLKVTTEERDDVDTLGA